MCASCAHPALKRNWHVLHLKVNLICLFRWLSKLQLRWWTNSCLQRVHRERSWHDALCNPTRALFFSAMFRFERIFFTIFKALDKKKRATQNRKLIGWAYCPTGHHNFLKLIILWMMMGLHMCFKMAFWWTGWTLEATLPSQSSFGQQWCCHDPMNKSLLMAWVAYHGIKKCKVDRRWILQSKLLDTLPAIGSTMRSMAPSIRFSTTCCSRPPVCLKSGSAFASNNQQCQSWSTGE